MGLLGVFKKAIKVLKFAAPVAVVGTAAVAVAKDPDVILKLKEKFEGLDLFSSSTDEQGNPVAGNANIGVLCDAIRTDCMKHGIAADDNLTKEILSISEEIMNKKFENLSEQEKVLVRDAYVQAKQQMVDLIESGQISPDASSKELLQEFWRQFVSIRYSGLSQGEVNSILQESNNTYRAEIFRKLDEAGKIQYISDQQVKQADDYSAEVARIKMLPQAEQAEALKKLSKTRRAKSKIDIANIAATESSEVALHSVKLGASSELSENMNTILRTRSSAAERMRTADLADFGFTKDLIKSYSAVGDSIQPDDLRDYTETIVSAKSANGVTAYQNEYVADRNNYLEAKAKQARGEALTPEQQELVDIMDEALYTSTAQGIGAGAMANLNMTDAQKAEFYAKWEYEAQQFGDYEAVVGYVNSKIASNPSVYLACQEAKAKYELQMAQKHNTEEKNINIGNVSNNIAGTAVAEERKSEQPKEGEDNAEVNQTSEKRQSASRGMTIPTELSSKTSSQVKTPKTTDSKMDARQTSNVTPVINPGKKASDIEIQKALDVDGAKFADVYKQYGEAVLTVVFNDMARYGKYLANAVSKFESMTPDTQKLVLNGINQTALPKLMERCSTVDFKDLIDENHLTHDYKYLIEDNERVAQ